jgi:hypothetical protein
MQRLAMKDVMKEILESIVPPTPEIDDPDEAAADEPDVRPAVPAQERSQLLPRQEAFCAHYVTQPVATRAAVLAGYAERTAYKQGHRQLQQAEVLERIAELRAARNLTYVLERDTMHDKLEGVFWQALVQRDYAPAIAAVRVQATLAGLLPGARIGGRAARPAQRRKTMRKSARAGAK